jgi:NitT/TauT family transport system substrate-binding protein
MVLVPQKWIDTNPKAVQAFVTATQAGWLHYLNGDPSPANALIKRDNPEMNDALIKQAIAKLKSYGIVLSGDAKTFGLGTMTDAKWKAFFDTMTKVGLYPKTLPYKEAYDLRFVHAMPVNFE